jgi:hypothetical protein
MSIDPVAPRACIATGCTRAFLLASSLAICFAPWAAARAEAALLHEWAADGDATDSVGNDDGEVIGGVSYGDGLFGQGFVFDGIDDGIGFGTSAGDLGSSDFTVAFVIRTTLMPPLASVLGKRAQCSPGSFWDIRFYANGTIILELLESRFDTGVTTTTAINDGLFHTVVFTRAGSVVSSYVDGFLNNQKDSGFVANVSNSASLMTGLGACTGVDSTVPFEGTIDEIRLDDSADPALLPGFLHCGDANGNGSISASDALVALRSAIGLEPCALCLCDTNQSDKVTAGDALAVLRRAVGQQVDMLCTLCPVELPD